jgi:hypothetical protein
MQLYRLAEAYNAIWDQIEKEQIDGECEQSIFAQLDGISDAVESKLENTVKLLRSLELLEQLMSEEARRWAAKASRMQRKADSIKDYLKESLEVMGVPKHRAGIFNLRIVQNSQPTVEVLNEDMIPTMYDLPTSRRIDKRAIADAVMAGVNIEGVQVYRGTHLRIDR